MNLHIKPAYRIEEVQEVFHRAYPYLKIEFFNKPHQWEEVNPPAYRYDPDFNLGNVTRHYLIETDIPASPWVKTGELEASFEILGLHVQVYRRHGDMWIETAGSDRLSLFEQNEMGKKASVETHQNLWIERAMIV